MSGERRLAGVGPLAVALASALPAARERFARLAPCAPPGGRDADADVDADVEYTIRSEGAGLVLDRDGRWLARSPHLDDLLARLALDVRGRIEERERAALWLHAACALRPDGGALVLLGASGAGKSTAALELTRHGWRYAAEDQVLLQPPARAVCGLGWPIRLDAAPPGRAELERLGYHTWPEVWHGRDGVARRKLCIAPPADRVAGAGAHPLAALVLLERGPAAVRPITAGELLVRLWPERIARADGGEPWSPAALAVALSTVPAAILRTREPAEIAPTLAGWRPTAG